MRVGLVAQIVAVLAPFAVRTVFIRTLGSEYLGLNGLFTSILSVLSLTELGFGTAIVFSMYQAIAEDDNETMCALLLLFRRVYRIIGAIILISGLLLIPFLPHLIKGSWPGDINLTVVYLIYLLNTVSSYFMYAYIGSLFSAFQREDIITWVTLVFNTVKYGIQIYILVAVRNYYAFIILMPGVTVLSNLVTAFLARRMYPKYRPRGELSEEIKSVIKTKVGGLVISRVCNVTRNSLDSIFISMFLGLTSTAIYNNYFYIMNSVIAIVNIATVAIRAGAGNSVAMETADKNHSDMMRLNFGYMWVSGWCTVCLLCLYQHFMFIWAGPELMMPMSGVIMFCLYFYVLKMGDIRSVYVEAKGIWWENRFRALSESAANLVLNYVLGKAFGMNGIIVATLISLFVINFCYGSTLIYKYYFTEQKPGGYFAFHGKCAAVTAVVSLATFIVCEWLPMSLPGFLCKMGVCVILPNLLFFVIYRKTSLYKNAMPWLLEKIGINPSGSVYEMLTKGIETTAN